MWHSQTKDIIRLTPCNPSSFWILKKNTCSVYLAACVCRRLPCEDGVWGLWCPVWAHLEVTHWLWRSPPCHLCRNSSRVFSMRLAFSVCYFILLYFTFKTGSLSMVLAGLKPVILLLQPPEYQPRVTIPSEYYRQHIFGKRKQHFALSPRALVPGTSITWTDVVLYWRFEMQFLWQCCHMGGVVATVYMTCVG